VRLLVSIMTMSACAAASQGVSSPPGRAANRSAYASCFVEPIASALVARFRACGTEACRLAIANGELAAERYEQAAPFFLRIAHGPNGPLAAQAAELALESTALLGNRTRPARPGCFDLLEVEVPQLLDKFCSPVPAFGAKKVCATLYSADVDLARCSECGKASVSGRDPDWEKAMAARLLLEINARTVTASSRVVR